jgi:hypothetical protein
VQNIDLEITPSDILVIKVDLSQEISYTRSNRSIRIGSTEGNILLWHEGRPHPKGIKFNLNVFRNLTSGEKEAVAKSRKQSEYLL